MEKIPCFLCGKPILLTKTKQGFLSFYCHACRFRGFLNSDSALNAIQAYIIDSENPEAEVKENPPPGENKEISAIIQEVKKLRDEVTKLKAEGTFSPNPKTLKTPKTKTGSMANWLQGKS